MNNEIELLTKISNDVADIKIILEIIQNGFLYFLGGIVAFFVIYILYKAISNFISF